MANLGRGERALAWLAGAALDRAFDRHLEGDLCRGRDFGWWGPLPQVVPGGAARPLLVPTAQAMRAAGAPQQLAGLLEDGHQAEIDVSLLAVHRRDPAGR